MRKFFAAISAAVVLGGCAVGPAPTIFDDDPRTWGPTHQARLASLPLLGYGGVCDLTRRQLNDFGQSKAENMLEAELKRRGLTNRDIELITDREAIYGTGMTFTGLSCALRREPRTNKAFYGGVGHRWQADTGFGYVYLEGNGTDRGMRVTSWN